MERGLFFGFCFWVDGSCLVTFKFSRCRFFLFWWLCGRREGSKRARLLDFFRERPLTGYGEAAEAVGTTVGYARKVLCLERKRGRRHRLTKKDYIFAFYNGGLAARQGDRQAGGHNPGLRPKAQVPIPQVTSQ